MTNKYFFDAVHYLSLLENGKSHQILAKLQSKSKILIKHEIRLLKCWVNNMEKQIFSTFMDRAYLMNQRVNFYKGLKQVINYLEGYILLPSDHISKSGFTQNLHHFDKEVYLCCDFCAQKNI